MIIREDDYLCMNLQQQSWMERLDESRYGWCYVIVTHVDVSLYVHLATPKASAHKDG